MKIKYLIGVFLLFFINIKFSQALTQKSVRSPIVMVQNKTVISEDYPVVDKIELKVIGRSSPKEDIYKRLSLLETKVFGTVSQKNLSDRVDALNKAVIGENEDVNEENDDSYSQSFSSKNYSEDEYNSRDFDEESLSDLLNQMEKKLLNQVYPNDTKEERVARLERYIFNGSSDNYSMDERVERLASVIKSQPENEIYQDLGQLNNNNSQMVGNAASLATIILMIIAGLLL